MKRFSLIALAALAAALMSCEQPINGVKIDTNSIVFNAEGGSQTLEVKADMPWTITLDDDSWVSVSPTSGSSTTNVTVRVQPNPMKDRERSARLTVSYNEQTLTVDVRQEKKGGDPVFSINPKSFDVTYAGGEISFTVVSDAQDYDITIVDAWITEVSRQGDRYTGETLTYSVAPNMQKDARSGVVSVCLKDGSCIPVTINQTGFSGKTYAHMNIGYRFTATWCGYCPYMDSVFQAVRESNSDFDFVTLHASKGYPLYFPDSDELTNVYAIDGFPTGVINGWKEVDNVTNVAAGASKLQDVLKEFNETFLCVAGISVTTQLTDGGISVEATVETSVDGDFAVTAFVLESGIVKSQTYYPAEGGSTTLADFVHDNVARTTLTSNVTGDSFTVKAGEPMHFGWSVATEDDWNRDKLSVAVIVSRPYDDTSLKTKKKYPDYYFVNAVVAPAGKSVEMAYE